MSGTSTSVAIDLGERSYGIAIGSRLIDDPASYDGLPSGAQAVIVSNTTVAPLYAQRLKNAIGKRHREVRLIELPDGEEYKTWESLNQIFDGLLAGASDRK